MNKKSTGLKRSWTGKAKTGRKRPNDSVAWNEEGENKTSLTTGCYVSEETSMQFLFEFQEGPSLWIYSDGYGQVKGTADFVEAFLGKFRPNECLGFEWANTCDKPRLSAFGGGAVLITGRGQKYVTSYGWLSRKIATFNGRKSK
jgi:hypothetical protein